MRKYHRWLAVIFGVFFLWIATTGVASQLAALYANGGFKDDKPSAAIIPQAKAHDNAMQAAAPAAAAAAPKPPQTPARKLVSTLHHLHSGESFGPVGVIVSTLSGLALLFFAFSGLWMYIQMFRNRGKRDNDRFFWR